jgi:hypothetical protein
LRLSQPTKIPPPQFESRLDPPEERGAPASNACEACPTGASDRLPTVTVDIESPAKQVGSYWGSPAEVKILGIQLKAGMAPVDVGATLRLRACPKACILPWRDDVERLLVKMKMKKGPSEPAG